MTRREFIRDFYRADWRLDAKGERELRLKPYAELSREFNAAGDFLLLPGCELTHWCKQADADKVIRRELHMNVFGLDETMPYLRRPDFKINDNKTWGRDDTAVAAYIADLSRQVSAFAKELGVSQPYFSLNHPVWPWYDIQPEDLIANSMFVRDSRSRVRRFAVIIFIRARLLGLVGLLPLGLLLGLAVIFGLF